MQHSSCAQTLFYQCFLLLLFCFCSYTPSYAQEYASIHFMTTDGLPSNNIYCITQDHSGFIWVATETGLSRFDGTRFRNFTVKDGLPTNEVYGIMSDHKDRLWISPFKKEICYYYKGRIYNKFNSALIRKIPISKELKNIGEDAAGNLFIQSGDQAVFINTNDSCTVFPSLNKKPGFFKLAKGIGSFYTNYPAVRPAGMPYFGQTTHDDSRPNYMIWRAEDKTYIYCDTTQVAVFPPLYDAAARVAADSLYIVCNKKGVFIYNLKSRKLLRSLLKGIWTTDVLLDSESGMWVGTHGFGLYYFPPGKNISIVKNADLPLQFLNFYCYGNRLIASTGDFHFEEIDRRTYALKRSISHQQLDGRLFSLPEGNLWKPAYDALPDILRLLRHSYPILSVKSIQLIQDAILIACYDKAVIIPGIGSNVRHIWNARATCAYAIRDTCYTGTLDGLYAFSLKDTVVHNEQNTKCLLKGTIVSMVNSYKNGISWVITADNGVYCREPSGAVHNISEVTGLSSNICKCIFTDGSRVFVGTNNGLNIIDPEDSFSVRSYYSADGLISNDINCIYAEDNTVYAGTSGGYSVLDISSLPVSRMCRIELTDITVSGNHLAPDTPALTLQPQHNNLELKYSGLSFRSMGKIRYTYRLKGLVDKWQTTTEQVISYPSLPAGNYRFELFATNRYGVKSATLSLPIVIQHYWWDHWWIVLFAFLLIAGLLLFTLQQRAKNIRLRDQEKNQLRIKISELEQVALRAQMNPHFIFNSLNSFYQYVINRDLSGASRFMNDFSTLIRLMFEITALKELSLDKELHFLETYLSLERAKLNQSFSFTFHIQADLIPQHILIPTFIIQPFIENSVRHGVSHVKDKAGHIDISVTAGADEMTVSIEDNGVGRAYTASLKQSFVAIHQSRGIALTAERIKLYNESRQTNIKFEIADKQDEKGNATGTLVRIVFPLKDITG